MLFLLSIIHAECRKHAHYAECRYAECHYAECCSAIFAHLACSQNEVILFLEHEELTYFPINIGKTVAIF